MAFQVRRKINLRRSKRNREDIAVPHLLRYNARMVKHTGRSRFGLKPTGALFFFLMGA